MAYDLPMVIYALSLLKKGLPQPQVNDLLKKASDRIIKGNVKYWDVEELLGIQIPRDIDHIDLKEPQPNGQQAKPGETGGAGPVQTRLPPDRNPAALRPCCRAPELTAWAPTVR